MRRTIFAILVSGLACIATSARAASCTEGSKFDNSGVAIFDYGAQSWGDVSNMGVQYNPTNIAQLARSCINTFRQNRKAEEWTVALAQIHWLMSNAVFIGPNLAGYQHHFVWNYGLKAGWYSGSAQSSAIRALVEYFRDTQDESVVHLIQSLKNFMMLPVAKGGTLQETPEGGAWIEEFPSDPPSLALGGDIDGLLALRAIADAFNDTQAERDFQIIFSSLRTSLKQYDTGSWFHTDRYSARPPALAHDMYGLAFVRLLMQLFEITHDPLMLSTSLRWGSFYEEGSRNSHGTVKRDLDGYYRLSGGLAKFSGQDVLKGNIEEVTVTPISIPGFGADKLFDGNIDTYFGADEEGPATVLVKLKKPGPINTLRIGLYNKELYPTDLRIEIKSEGEQDFRPIPYDQTSDRRYLYLHFAELNPKEVKIAATKFNDQNRLVISEIWLGRMDWTDRTIPNCSRTTDPVRMGGSSFRLSLDAPHESKREVFVIYRHANTNEGLAKASWQWDTIIPETTQDVAQGADLYQFRVLCTQAVGERGWKGLEIMSVPGNQLIYRE
ncbi:D-glucuronyl C5-epimerase family protein [Bradyrhizobium sp. B117]|uniref:D-glucuronyl C5-epimerase family protein n=1 Tax=Bradyrhizobium sp. B117 TaxID=3140246 RepID=UPI003183F77E